MRHSTIVASAALALFLAPASSTAQDGPDWIFEVPFDLETLNQNITEVKVGCGTYVQLPDLNDVVSGPPAPNVGNGWSEPISLDATGSRAGVVMVPVSAWSDDPGRARHYLCTLTLYSGQRMASPDPGRQEIEFQPKPGTQLVKIVTGTLR